MARLAIYCADDNLFQAVSSRLREADVVRVAAGAALESIDALAVLSPLGKDAEFVTHAVRGGKHVLLTAAACLGAAECDDWLFASAAANARLAVVNPDRYLPSRALVKQCMESGSLGEAGLLRIHRWETGDIADLPEVHRACGLLCDLDLACWLIGRWPKRAYASLNRNGTTRCLQVHLTFAGGATALVEFANRLPSSEGYQSLSVVGSEGAVYADDQQNMLLLYEAGGPRAVRVDEGCRNFVTPIQELVDGLNAGRPLARTGMAWMRVQIIAKAVKTSLDTRKTIEWTDS